VLLGIGVGTCIISNGELYRGATLPIARLLTAGAVLPRQPDQPRRTRSVAAPG
jgi:hypothetical protein